MRTALWVAAGIAALWAVGCGSGGGAGVRSATTTVSPIPLPGSPDCDTAAAALGLGGPFDGTRIPTPWASMDPYALDSLGNTVTFDFTTPQRVFDWTATLGIDFILVRGYDTGTQAYVYAPEATSGTGLRAPPASEGAPDDRVSYVKLCFDSEASAGCTLTQGYWKTHSKYGPAPYDGTWALLGEDTAFFLAGATYFQVLRTEPRGNPYYILAKQFIAAKLNGLAGASLTGVATAMTDAEALFASTAPGGARAVASQFLTLAGQLGDFNEGRTGPGHCDGELSAQ